MSPFLLFSPGVRMGSLSNGDAPPPSYARTAFVSSTGDDGTAALNDPDLPYLTLEAAVFALVTAHPAEATTLRLLSNISTGLDYSPEVDNVLTAGLTIMSHDETVWSVNNIVSLGQAGDSILALHNVTLATVSKIPLASTTPFTAVTITGSGTTTISSLDISADSNAGTTGSDGSTGPSPVGSPGTNGNSNDPPDMGGAGESVNGDGEAGGSGGEGNAAWNLTLVGVGTVTSLTAVGGGGGSGGVGGAGGVPTGGTGGTGGNSTAPSDPQDGGAGGQGGSVNASGGTGGSGGPGGFGGTVTKAVGWTITSSNLIGGGGGAGGTGGQAGSGTVGTGGVGGNGANGGNSGSSGDDGVLTAEPGADGLLGADGVAGSII